MNKFCGYCGKELEEQVKFCAYCGKSLVNTQSNKVLSVYNNPDSIKKIIAFLSAAVLLILFFFKWFQVPVLISLNAFFGYGYNDFGNIAGISSADWSGRYSVLGLALLLIRNFDLDSASTFDMNENDILVIMITILVIIVFYLIALISLIIFIRKFISFYLKNSLDNTFVYKYNGVMTSAIIMFIVIFVTSLVINKWISSDDSIFGTDTPFVVLSNSFYAGAFIAVVSRIFSSKLFKFGGTTAPSTNE